MATVKNINELSHDKFDLWQTFDNGKGNFQLPGNHRALFFRVKKSNFSVVDLHKTRLPNFNGGDGEKYKDNDKR